MEQLNQVTLRGFVGSVRVNEIGDTQIARFSVGTEYAYRNNGGDFVIETTWTNVVAFKGKGMPDFSAIVKGASVEVSGRLRNNRFVDSNGAERTVTEVMADRIVILK